MSTLLSVADAVSLYSFSDAVSTVAYCYRVCLFYLFYYTPFKCFLNATQTPRGAKYPDTLLDVYDVVVWEVNAPLCWGIEPSQILDLYASCLGERHLDIGPGTGKFLFQAVTKKVVHLKDLSLFDFNTISLFRCKKRLNVRNLSVPTLNVRLFAGDIMESDPFLNPSISGPPYEWIEPNEFDSVSANFVLHCINKNDGIPSKEALFLNVSKVLKAGGCFFGSTIVNDLDFFAGSKRGGEVMGKFNESGIFYNAKDTLPDLVAMLNKHFKDVHCDLVGGVAVFKCCGK